MNSSLAAQLAASLNRVAVARKAAAAGISWMHKANFARSLVAEFNQTIKRGRDNPSPMSEARGDSSPRFVGGVKGDSNLKTVRHMHGVSPY